MPSDEDIERILVVTAHPDDVDFGSAGSVASWTDAGIEVSYCIITNGEAGGFDDSVPRPTVAEIRQAEQRAAAKVVGVSDLTFLGYPDGRLLSTIELRRDISRVIRRVSSAVSATPSGGWTGAVIPRRTPPPDGRARPRPVAEYRCPPLGRWAVSTA